MIIVTVNVKCDIFLKISKKVKKMYPLTVFSTVPTQSPSDSFQTFCERLRVKCHA